MCDFDCCSWLFDMGSIACGQVLLGASGLCDIISAVTLRLADSAVRSRNGHRRCDDMTREQLDERQHRITRVGSGLKLANALVWKSM